MIGSRTGVRNRPHRVFLQNPGPAVSDGDGAYTQVWTDCEPPSVDAEILEANHAALERIVSNTVASTASHIVSMPYHPQVTTQTRIIYNGRRFSVTGVDDVEQRHVDLVLPCVEVVA
jgi:SPP1 family predicted phage head-tail adaptor